MVSVDLKEFEDYCKQIKEAKIKKASERYGRNRIFLTSAMKRLADNSTFLSSEYEKLSRKGKEIFGYHHNEIILSFIFIKYVINNDDLMKKYMSIRSEEIRKKKAETLKELDPEEREKVLSDEKDDEIDIEELRKQITPIEPKKEIDEMDSSSSGGFSQPMGYIKRKMNENINQPEYLFYILDDEQGKLVSGFEYKEDAKEYIDNTGKKSLRIFKKSFLKNNGLDPDNDESWGTDMNEMDSSSSGSYEQPAAWAKNSKNWRHFQKPLKGYKILKPNTEKHIQGIKSYTFVNEENILIEPELVLESMSMSGVNKVKNENIEILKLNDLNVDDFINNKLNSLTEDDIIEVIFKINIDNFKDDIFKTSFKYFDLIQFIEDEFFDSKTEKEELLNHLSTYSKETIIQYILNNTDKIENITEKMDEHHITSKENKVTFILNNTDDFTEEQLKSMNDDEIDAIYNEIEEKEMINEESKHPALTNLDRIKKNNDKNETEYFKTLNKGVQDELKNSDEGGEFKYDYDKDSLDKKDLPKFNQDENPLKKHVELNRGRTPFDLDFDVPPSKAYWDRVKEQIGEENFKIMKEKAEKRAMERMSMRAGKFEQVKEKENLKNEIRESFNELLTNLPTDLQKLFEEQEIVDKVEDKVKDAAKDIKNKYKVDDKKAEEIAVKNLEENEECGCEVEKVEDTIIQENYIKGLYKNHLNQNVIIDIPINSSIEINELNENLTLLKTEGLGNSLSTKIKDGEFIRLKENKEIIDNYKFYIDLNENKIYKIKNIKFKLNENIIKGYNKSVTFNYKK